MCVVCAKFLSVSRYKFQTFQNYFANSLFVCMTAFDVTVSHRCFEMDSHGLLCSLFASSAVAITVISSVAKNWLLLAGLSLFSYSTDPQDWLDSGLFLNLFSWQLKTYIFRMPLSTLWCNCNSKTV